MPYLEATDGRRELSPLIDGLEGRRSPCVGHWLPPADGPPRGVPGGAPPSISARRSSTRPMPESREPWSRSIWRMLPWALSSVALDCSSTIMLMRRRSATPSFCVSAVVRTVSAKTSVPLATMPRSCSIILCMLRTDCSTRLMPSWTTSSTLRRMLSSACLSWVACRSDMRLVMDFWKPSLCSAEGLDIASASSMPMSVDSASACLRICSAWILSSPCFERSWALSTTCSRRCTRLSSSSDCCLSWDT
mmetsp:Transcript_96997/g.250872  ORF Transcript_96997/g.250872 Transcript_96997/m.250872 type:complete len:248 (+) Transcript_96997:546-1289(+)